MDKAVELEQSNGRMRYLSWFLLVKNTNKGEQADIIFLDVNKVFVQPGIGY